MKCLNHSSINITTLGTLIEITLFLLISSTQRCIKCRWSRGDDARRYTPFLAWLKSCNKLPGRENKDDHCASTTKTIFLSDGSSSKVVGNSDDELDEIEEDIDDDDMKNDY
ncbi:hypothetical protein ACS0TY_013367 [Phlomoides rotata]